MAKTARGTLMTQSRKMGPEQKALFHNTLGAGAGRVVREFLGLTPSDEATLLTRIEARVQKRLDDQFR